MNAIARDRAWPGISVRLEGTIVDLEPIDAGHEPELFAAAGDERIWRWFGHGRHLGSSAQEFAQAFGAALRASQQGAEQAFTTRSRRDGRAIGSTSLLELRRQDRGVEIGSTWLTPAAWGSGANADAKRLLLSHAFETLGCVRVEFKTDALNERSRAALAALPARFEGIFRKHRLMHDGRWRDSAWYSVVDDEWPAVKANLERRVTTGAPA